MHFLGANPFNYDYHLFLMSVCPQLCTHFCFELIRNQFSLSLFTVKLFFQFFTRFFFLLFSILINKFSLMNFHLSSGFESLRFVFCCRRQEHYGISLELWLCERCEWGRGRFWAWRTISHKKWRKYGNLVNEKYAKMTEKKTSRIACKMKKFHDPEGSESWGTANEEICACTMQWISKWLHSLFLACAATGRKTRENRESTGAIFRPV